MSSREQDFFHKALRLPKAMVRYARGAATFPQKHRAQNARIDQLEAALAENEPDEKLADHIPTILNYVTSFAHTSSIIERKNRELQNSLDETRMHLQSHDKSLKEIYNRIEFVRREILFEFMHSTPSGAEAPSKTESMIINEEKLASMKDEIKLNLGCGNVPIAEYINVDSRELPGVDIVADVNDLPFSEGSVTEIFSSHLVEHFPLEEFRRQILPYWYELLMPGGMIHATLPDWEAMITKFSQGTYNFDDLREVTFGAQDYQGDFHYNMFSQELLREALEMAGFTDISFPATGRVNGKSLEMEVVAVK
jgi:predicted SAM-dependent methyltransferase